MRYVIRTLLGMGLFAFCWVAIGYGIFQLLQVGTCASGGPYVSARECPDGIERLMFSPRRRHPRPLRRAVHLRRPRRAARLGPQARRTAA